MKKQQQKTREPYGKVTEVGQVPIALHEISELAGKSLKIDQQFEPDARFEMIRELNDSIIAVTCANPGCLSQMAEDLPHGELEMIASGSLKPKMEVQS